MEEMNPTQPITETQTTSPDSQSPKSKTLLYVLIGLVLLLIVGGGGYYLLAGNQQETTSAPTVTSAPSGTEVTVSPEPSKTETGEVISPTSVKAVVPTSWKQYSVTHPLAKWTAKLSLPPGYKFESAGSGNLEAWIFNEKLAPKDSLSYRNSIGLDEDNKIKNIYDGSSRREWYKGYLKRSNLDVESVVEKTDSGISYLEIKVKLRPPLTVNHYLFVKDGVAHILEDGSEEDSASTQLRSNIGLIFSSLSFTY